jgi:hypothetical protein
MDSTNLFDSGLILSACEYGGYCTLYPTCGADLGSCLLDAFDLARGQSHFVGVKYVVDLGDADIANFAAWFG